MNSEKRHELQHNILADHLGSAIKRIEPYTKLIAVVFGCIVAGFVALGLFKNSQTIARSDATLELLQNAGGGDPEALAQVSTRYPDTVAGTIAKLYEADANLGLGITQLYADREDATAKIKDAIGAYTNVVATAKDKFLVARANLGLGRAHESLGDLKDATAAYQKAASMTDNDAIIASANQRIELLKTSDTKDFLAWFAKQDFKQADPSMPPLFPDGNELPDLPDLDLPEIEPMTVPNELKSSTDDLPTAVPGDIELPAIDGDASMPAETATDFVGDNPSVRATDETP